MLRDAILSAAASHRMESLLTQVPVTRHVVERYTPGAHVDDAIAASRELTAAGLLVSLDFLGEDVSTRDEAVSRVRAYKDVLDLLATYGLTAGVEVSVKLSAIGQALPDADGAALALEHARQICAVARRYGTTVTLDMEDHTTTDSTLTALAALREDFPTTGAVLQSYLYRTEADCKDLATAGSRVRLCKGAYDEPESVAYQRKRDVDRSYVRCLKVLMVGAGYPMVATHDPRLIEIAGALAARHDRGLDTFEYQMLYGIRPHEQLRLAAEGARVRVYVPYGNEWYGYLMRRLAERPANLGFFLRSLVTRS